MGWSAKLEAKRRGMGEKWRKSRPARPASAIWMILNYSTIKPFALRELTRSPKLHCTQMFHLDISQPFGEWTPKNPMLNLRMYVCMYVCMYIYIYIYIYLYIYIYKPIPDPLQTTEGHGYLRQSYISNHRTCNVMWIHVQRHSCLYLNDQWRN